MRLPSHWHVHLSRRVNAWRGGCGETVLCAALHDEGSRWCVVIDAVMWIRDGRGHCAAMAAWERDRRREGGPVERARAAGW